MNPAPALPPAVALQQLATAYWVSQSLSVAATLGVADQLGAEPRPVAELAAAASADPDALYRVMRALAAFGVFHEAEGRRFALGPLGGPLRGDAPDSVRGFVRMVGAEQFRAWAALEQTVRGGQPAFDAVFGDSIFDFYRHNPGPFAIFHQAMEDTYRGEADAFAARYPFAGVERVLDVGGGNGTLLAAILKGQPQLSGILFDLDDAIAAARAAPPPRCTLVAGDFFRAVPPGADLHLLKHVLHDWDDSRCIAILSQCRRSIGDNGRLVILEAVIGPANLPDAAKLLDLHMMAITGGRERSEAQYAALLAEAGFRHLGSREILPELTAIEAVPA
jgi:SAM-dependent methyltransferase